jgi:hypothetical protein
MDDDLSIPEYLKRNKDGTLANPRPVIQSGPIQSRNGGSSPPGPTIPWPPTGTVIKAAIDAELQAWAESSELTLVERQPIYRELRDREDKRKAYARIAAMKEKMNAGSKGVA